MKKITVFLKSQPILSIITVLAFFSCLIIRPDRTYLTYINFQTLAVLFCLMAIVAGLSKSGLLDKITAVLLKKSSNSKMIAIILVNISFFLSMFVTNDVALVTLVPLTIAIFKPLRQKVLIFVLIMETIAANLGGMLLPTGNPQNLYLYSYYKMNIGEFFAAITPAVIISYLLIMLLMLTMKAEALTLSASSPEKLTGKRNIVIYAGLFILILLSVLDIIDYRIVFAVSLGVFLVTDAKILKKVDYELLLTFIAFFIFVGNIQRIDSVNTAIKSLISGREFLSAILISQICSNVPAAMMLSGFTDNAKALLLGVDVGGLGTIIASMASLITYGLYAKSESADKPLFFGMFSLYNAVLLVILSAAGLIMGV